MDSYVSLGHLGTGEVITTGSISSVSPGVPNLWLSAGIFPELHFGPEPHPGAK